MTVNLPPGRGMPPRAAERLLARIHSDKGDYTHLGDFSEVYARIQAEKGTPRFS